MGSGSTSGPQFLMDREIVAVFINYRLSSFGFLAAGTREIPGNAALKDQSLALRWVQKNIRHFGGDPDRVTLSGQSAGAHSVTAHLISPMSRGLFHRVIALSGALAWQKDLQRDNLDAARKQAGLVNCTTESVAAMLACLHQTPFQAIVNTNSRIAEIAECPMLAWMPVVEPDFGQERFIEEEPVKLFREGRFHRVPVLTGVTEDEFSSNAQRILNSPEVLQSLNDDFDRVAPLCFNYESDTNKSLAISASFRRNYFPFNTIDRRSFNNLLNVRTLEIHDDFD
jgi:acetylcholinesterase